MQLSVHFAEHPLAAYCYLTTTSGMTCMPHESDEQAYAHARRVGTSLIQKVAEAHITSLTLDQTGRVLNELHRRLQKAISHAETLREDWLAENETARQEMLCLQALQHRTDFWLVCLAIEQACVFQWNHQPASPRASPDRLKEVLEKMAVLDDLLYSEVTILATVSDQLAWPVCQDQLEEAVTRAPPWWFNGCLEKMAELLLIAARRRQGAGDANHLIHEEVLRRLAEE